MKIHTISEYENLVVKVSEGEFQKLKESIKEDGQHYAIAVNESGIVLDGHHRLRACTELGINVKIQVMKFANKLLEKKFVIIANLKRRQLNARQKLLAFKALRIIYGDLKKLTKKEGQKLGGKKHALPKILGKANKKKREKTADELAAQDVGWSDTTALKAKHVEDHGNEEEQKLLDNNKIDSAYKKIIYRKKREEQKEEFKKLKLEKEFPIYHGEFQNEKYRIKNDSISLIFTDPPYNQESLPLYNDLASLAVEKLEPGGSLVCYAGHYALPEIFERMKNPELEYWWIIAAMHESMARIRMRKHNVLVSWKPLLWFVKRGNTPKNIRNLTMFADSVKSRPPINDKLGHKWEQSTDEAKYVIEHLTSAGDMVLDPMCGSGTTGEAAKLLERNFIGIEKDESHRDDAYTRVNA